MVAIFTFRNLLNQECVRLVDGINRAVLVPQLQLLVLRHVDLSEGLLTLATTVLLLDEL